MKKLKFLALFLVVAVVTVMTTGCEAKREELKFEGKEGTIVFNVKAGSDYKISTDKADFRTSREQAALVGKDFKIGIEFNDDFGYFFKGDFDALKAKRKDYPEYKEIEYSGIKGIQYFYGSYMYYEIILPCGDSKDYDVILTVRGNEDNEKSAKAAIANEEVQDILNHITTIKSAK